MTQIAILLELRNKIKNKKPVFIRQDNPKRPKLSDKWRKPKGIHSKIRHHFKGRRKMPSPGYKSPVEVKGLHTTGLEIVRVFSADDIKKLDKEKQGIVISKAVGTKKRLEILKIAKELNIKILNLNADDAIKKIEDFLGKKKKPEAKKEQETKKAEAKQEPKKIEEAQKKGMTDEEKKEAEKKEKDKILTKKM